jgi:hypothetical protein
MIGVTVAISFVGTIEVVENGVLLRIFEPKKQGFLTTHLHLAPRVRIHGAIRPLPHTSSLRGT